MTPDFLRDLYELEERIKRLEETVKESGATDTGETTA